METFIMQEYLSDTTICDDLITFFKENENKKQGSTYGGNVDKRVKDSIDLSVEHLPDDLRKRYYDNQLIKILDKYIDKYEYCLMAPFSFVEPGNIQYYKPGMGFHLYHCERTEVDFPNSTRHLAFMTYLNDVTDGGETEWYYQNLKIQPKKGLTVIWPTDWTHTHRGLTSQTQDKYIITGWLNYVART